MYEVIKDKAVYLVNEKPVGVVKWDIIDEQTVNVYHTYVDPNFRSVGIASKLLEYAFNYFFRK